MCLCRGSVSNDIHFCAFSVDYGRHGTGMVLKKYRKAGEKGEVKNLFNDLYEKGHKSGAKCLLAVGIGRVLHRTRWDGISIDPSLPEHRSACR